VTAATIMMLVEVWLLMISNWKDEQKQKKKNVGQKIYDKPIPKQQSEKTQTQTKTQTQKEIPAVTLTSKKEQ
jgi:hypothetical protein